MASTKSKKSRKAAAVALAIVGVAGLSLASAAQLTLNGGSHKLAQAATVNVSGSACQTSAIKVTFDLADTAAGTLATGTTFGYPSTNDAIYLTSVDPACVGYKIKVALGTSANAQVGQEYNGTVAAPVSPATSTVVKLALNGATPAFGTTALTNTQITSISQVSVTIFDAS